MKRDILEGDALQRLQELPSDSVDCIVTSPPYWALRDYGTEGQIGLEPTWRGHMERLRPIFAQLHRVLKPTGNLWVNYGDTVQTQAGGARDPGTWKGSRGGDPRSVQPAMAPNRLALDGPGRKHKLGLAWRLRFMLNDDLGFISRSDVVWHKPNAMPLSMKDRVTPKYEMFFHLVKQPRYYFDLDAIRTPFSDATIQRVNQPGFDAQTGGAKDYGNGQSTRRALANLRASMKPVGGKEVPPGQRLGAAGRSGSTGLATEPPRAWRLGDFFPGNDADRFNQDPQRERERESRKASFNIRVRDVAEGRAPLKWGAGVKASDAEVAAYAASKTPRDQERDEASVRRNGGGWKNGGRRKTAAIEQPRETDHLRGPPEPGQDGAFHPLGANPGDVWTIPTQPFDGAHFATYPEELVRRAVMASCPERVCLKCGIPARRVWEKEVLWTRGKPRGAGERDLEAEAAGSHKPRGTGMAGTGVVAHHRGGWTTCGCDAGFQPGIVLDPFAGSFTTCKVAAELGRGFIGIELNPEYVKIGRRRLADYMAPITSFAEAQPVEEST